MIRQGDVLLTMCSKFPSKAKRIEPINGRNILAYGEVTGHNHSVDCAISELFSIDGKSVLVVNESTVIEHQEHAAIEVTPGTYWVVHQREYTPQEIVRVRD